VSAPFRIDLRDASTFPTRRDEAWRWSDFARVVTGPAAPAPELAAPEPGGPFAAIEASETTFANGRLPAALVGFGDEAQPVRASPRP
jgi:Fe-S cluster assembly protein SufD